MSRILTDAGEYRKVMDESDALTESLQLVCWYSAHIDGCVEADGIEDISVGGVGD